MSPDMPDIASTPATDRHRQLDAVIELIEAGHSERSACEQVGINRNTFRAAIPKHKSADQYARALEAMAHAKVIAGDEVLKDMLAGVIDANQARVALDWHKWIACKFLPKLYGDRVQQVHTGADGGAVKVEQVSPLEEIEQRLQRLSERGEVPAVPAPGAGRTIN